MSKSLASVKSAARFPLLVTLAFVLVACSSMYYSAMEKIGVEKRDILVDRIDDANAAQNQVKEEFESALDEFQALTGFSGGELEDTYNRLAKSLERSENRAENLYEEIDEVERVAEDLFAEWQQELDQFQNASLRRDSARQLDQTRDRYQRVISRMHRAESRIEPALRPFRDQVLYLKHNLNARAIASLEGEAQQIEADISDLLAAIDASIREADQFLEQMSPR